MSDSSTTTAVREFVLTFIVQEGRVALGLKMQKIGQGKWMGFGGNVEEDDETIEEAAIRETREEAGVTPANMENRGVIDFHRNDKVNRVHMFATDDYGGEFSPNKEEIGEIRWFEVDKLDPEDWMEGDRYWLPQLLAGEMVGGEVHYSDEWHVTDHRIEFRPSEIVQERELSLK